MQEDPTKIKSPFVAPKLANYKDVAETYIKEHKEIYDTQDVIDFAKHLDSFQTLNSQMQIIALQATLKKYMEFYDIIKTDIAPEILEPCMDKFKKLNKKK